MPKSVFIVAAKRTPFGAFGGKLAHLTANELGGLASVAAVKELPQGVKIDSVIYGNVLQTSKDAPYLARHVGHRAQVPIESPALTVNRLCGSGFESVIKAAQEIILGEAEVVLAGGTESMSQAPHVYYGSRNGARFGQDIVLQDSLAHSLTDQYPKQTPMGITAENLAKKYNITREQADAFALGSQQKWAAAQKAGRFNAEIAPVEIKTKKGTELFSVDEHPRPQTTLETLGKLRPAFLKDGVVTAGNASGICDGAASLIVAGEDAVKRYGLTPLARIVSWNYCGVEPEIMGIGPVPSIKAALKRAGLTLDQMSQIEVNEAFCPQVLAVAKELKIDLNKLNINGGATSLGHPLGASGARITGHLVHELQRTGEKYALGSACIGGGQGITIILEKA
ncbi:Thiolase, N-terminal domain-containing protein [Gorgonomyces haynaldii]|nr:Thiolase, N-terminal domain-containing protein [Gorgonomyces haynaldii]